MLARKWEMGRGEVSGSRSVNILGCPDQNLVWAARDVVDFIREHGGETMLDTTMPFFIFLAGGLNIALTKFATRDVARLPGPTVCDVIRRKEGAEC